MKFPKNRGAETLLGVTVVLVGTVLTAFVLGRVADCVAAEQVGWKNVLALPLLIAAGWGVFLYWRLGRQWCRDRDKQKQADVCSAVDPE
jgi:hypothetical protein